MKNRMAMLAAAGALVGFLGFSGIALASAQDSSTTTTPSTTAPSSSSDDGTSSTAPAGRPNCHHDGTGTLDQAPTPAPSSTTTNDT